MPVLTWITPDLYVVCKLALIPGRAERVGEFAYMEGLMGAVTI